LRTKLRLTIVLTSMMISLCAFPKPSVSAEMTVTEAAVHQVLRQAKDDMLDAINRSDIDALSAHVHSNVVLTVENGQRYRGLADVRAFYNTIMDGEAKALKEFKVEQFEVDELSILYGDDTAIAFGSAVSKYVPINGPSLTVPSKWSTTLVRENGKWLVSAFHNTVDFTDNPLLDTIVWQAGMMWGVGGAIAGIVIGLFIGRRKRTAS